MDTYLGSVSDQNFIKNYLTLLRLTYPTEFIGSSHVFDLDQVLNNLSKGGHDRAKELLEYGLSQISKKTGSKSALPFNRCYFISGDIDHVGGFHGPNGKGYHHGFCASLSELPNAYILPENDRVYELARCYLHDHLHFLTFRAWRRDRTPKVEKEVYPSIYREQYGINFRNAQGISYSSPDQHRRVDNSINLNLLMDGVIVTVVQEILLEYANQHPGIDLGIHSEEIVRPHPSTFASDNAKSFYRTISQPTRAFLEYWGGNAIRDLILVTMCTGDLNDLHKYFSMKTGRTDAWEYLFRQPAFSL